MIRYKYALGCVVVLLGFLMAILSSHAQQPNNAQEPNEPMVYEGTVGGLRVIEEGQPFVMIHATVEDMKRFREANPHAQPGQVQAASTANDLTFHGGTGGIGVETAPKIYLVLWGSQWNNNDPSGGRPFWRPSTRGSVAALGRIASLSIARPYRAAWCSAAAQVRRPAIRPAFLRESGLTTQALRLQGPASRKLPPRPCAPPSTSATRRRPA